MSDLDQFQALCWKLIHKESRRDGITLRVSFNRLEIIYNRNRREVEVFWYPPGWDEDQPSRAFQFYAPHYVGEYGDQVTIWNGWPDAYAYLLKQVVLDELADV